jgi:hypothetical protein
MNYLVDTNILTRLAEPTHAMHQETLDAVALLDLHAGTIESEFRRDDRIEHRTQ